MLTKYSWFTHYDRRKLEWALAFYTLAFGLFLFLPGESFTGSAGFDGVTSIMREALWAALFTAVGSVHLYALHVNGRAAWTPFARVLALTLNALVLFNLGFGFWLYTPLSSGVFTYGFLSIVFCGMGIASAARDCGREVAIWRGLRNDR